MLVSSRINLFFRNNGLSDKLSSPALVAFYMLDLCGPDSG